MNATKIPEGAVKVDGRKKPVLVDQPFLSPEFLAAAEAKYLADSKASNHRVGYVTVHPYTGEAYEWCSWERMMSE